MQAADVMPAIGAQVRTGRVPGAIAAVLLTQVTPPEAAVFEAFTGPIERALGE